VKGAARSRHLGAGRFASGRTGVAPGHLIHNGDWCVSIVRIGLAESKDFSEGYDAIFGKKKSAEDKKAEPKSEAKPKAKKSKAKASAKKPKKKKK
jgi:hypothetical protein